MENKDFKIAHRRGSLWFGGILILVGALFLMFSSNTSWQVWKPIIISWQMLLIVIGFLLFCGRHFFQGTLLAIIGAFFLLPVLATAFPANFGWVEADFVQKYWALLIVVAGITIVLNGIFGKHYYRKSKFKRNEEWLEKYYFKTISSMKTENAMIDRNLVFSGRDEIFLESEFRGGHISCVFGGYSLDLRKSSLPEGETVLIVESVFSGVQIDVPDNWNVELRSVNILGGSTDSRAKNVEKDLTRKLVIAGKCVFGGIAVTSGYDVK